MFLKVFDVTETETALIWTSEVQLVPVFLKAFDVTETETALSWTFEVWTAWPWQTSACCVGRMASHTSVTSQWIKCVQFVLQVHGAGRHTDTVQCFNFFFLKNYICILWITEYQREFQHSPLANIAWSEWDAVTFDAWCWSRHSDRQKFVSLIFTCDVSSVKCHARLWAKIIFACEVNPVKWRGWLCAKIIFACEVNSVKCHVWLCAFFFKPLHLL